QREQLVAQSHVLRLFRRRPPRDRPPDDEDRVQPRPDLGRLGGSAAEHAGLLGGTGTRSRLGRRLEAGQIAGGGSAQLAVGGGPVQRRVGVGGVALTGVL